MNLREYRDAVAAALEQIGEEWSVHHGPHDAIQPPAFMLRWGPDPWREPAGVCADMARLEVVCMQPRLDVHQTADLLDDMVDAAAAALLDGGFRAVEWVAPHASSIGKITYIAAIARLVQPVTIGGH